MGLLFLSGAFIVSLLVALVAARWGIYLGSALLALGTIPGFYVFAAHAIFGIPVGESESMVIMLSLYYLSAPGGMMMGLSIFAIIAGWDR